MLQQEAYPAIPPCWCPWLAIAGAILPKWEKTCPRSGQTAMQNFMLIGQAPAEKSITVHKKQTNPQ